MDNLDDVPTIRGLTPYDNLARFMLRTDAYLDRCASLGDLVRLRMPDPSPVIAILSAPLTEEVLITKNRSFIKDRNTRRLIDVVGRGLLVSEGEQWRRQRRLAQPAFRRDQIDRYASAISAATDRVLNSWTPGATIDVHEAMMELTREVISDTLLSSAVGRRASKLSDAIDVVMGRFSDWRYGLMPWLGRLPLKRNRRYNAAKADMEALVDGIIAERRRDPEERGDLLSTLLRARDDDGSPMNDAQLRDEVLILLLAGHETTALLLTWTWTLLSDAPAVSERLRREIDGVLGGRPIGIEDMPKLPFLEAVLLEAMRLRPPAWSVGREAIEEVELGGVTIPRGTQVWMFAWQQHRDPRYFEQPLQFRPERWLDGLQRRLPRAAYVPFGGGPRLCIGANFAMVEASIILGTIVQRWSLDIPAGVRPRPDFSLTLRPKGAIPATLRARNEG